MTTPYRKDFGRFYDIEELPHVSVTTALDIIAKPGLMYWYASQERKMIFAAIEAIYEQGPDDTESFLKALSDAIGQKKAAEREGNKAARRGQKSHEAIEKALRGDDLPPMDRFDKDVFDAWWKWWKTTGFKVLAVAEKPAVEVVVYHKEHQFAGTLDCYARHPRRGLTVLDWKRGKRLYARYGLQNSAYRKAAETLDMPSDVGAVVRLTTSDPEIMECTYEKYPFEKFLSALDLWRWQYEMEEGKG